MAKIERLPSGTYRTRVFKNGKQKSITAKTRAELKMKVAEYEYLHDDTRDMSIEEIIDSYIDNRSEILSPSTLRSYRQIVKYYEPIKMYSATQITSEDIQKFVNDFAKDHSPKTTRNVYGLLSSALRTFYPNKAISVRLPQKKPIERFIPTTDAVKILLQDSDPELRKAILLASVGTMRRGEIAALKYGDIQGNTIHVHADIVRNQTNKWVYKDIPKTSESDRYIEYPAQVIKELGTGEPDEYVIKFSNPDMITKHFIKLRKDHGLRCRFHDLRAYAASIAHALGVPDEYIMKRGGWSSDAILKSVYRNALEDEVKKNSDKINDHLSGTLLKEEPKKKPRKKKEKEGPPEFDEVPEGYISIADYARQCGIAQSTVSHAIIRGKIPYVIVRGRKYIDSKFERNTVRYNKKEFAQSGTRLYSIWQNMKRRCYDPNSTSFRWYGALGIRVCDEWLDSDGFFEWALNNGYKEHLELDRIDPTKGYCPDNCRWVTKKRNIKRRREYGTVAPRRYKYR